VLADGTVPELERFTPDKDALLMTQQVSRQGRPTLDDKRRHNLIPPLYNLSKIYQSRPTNLLQLGGPNSTRVRNKMEFLN
jgi:hypothetical protein